MARAALDFQFGINGANCCWTTSACLENEEGPFSLDTRLNISLSLSSIFRNFTRFSYPSPSFPYTDRLGSRRKKEVTRQRPGGKNITLRVVAYPGPRTVLHFSPVCVDSAICMDTAETRPLVIVSPLLNMIKRVDLSLLICSFLTSFSVYIDTVNSFDPFFFFFFFRHRHPSWQEIFETLSLLGAHMLEWYYQCC